MDTPLSPDHDKIGDALKAQRFQMLEDIAKELAGDIVFPTYFDAAFRLRKELQNADLSLTQLANRIAVEPLISAKLLHLANSVLYNPSGATVRNLVGAIQRLGLEVVRSTALTIAMGQMMRSRDLVEFADLTKSLWTHTLHTAAAARVIARRETRLNPDDALLAGLVHDLGAFYMIYRAAKYPELRQRPDTLRYLIVQWHEGIGVSLLNAIGLPEEIVDATIDHDQPRLLPESIRTLPELIYVSNILAGGHFEWLYQDIDPEAGEPGLIRTRYAHLVDEINTNTEEMQAVFD